MKLDKRFKPTLAPPLYNVSAIYDTPEGFHGWILETVDEKLRFIPQIITTEIKSGILHYAKPNLMQIIRKFQYQNAEKIAYWINELPLIRFPHQIEALMREVTINAKPFQLREPMSPEVEVEVLNAICEREGWSIHITSKSHPLRTIGTHWDHFQEITDWGIQPMDKQGREFRSLFKNAIYWDEGAIDKWGIIKPFTVAFCDCPLFSGINGDQPCCDMIAVTKHGHNRIGAHYDFDSNNMLRNATKARDGVDYEEYESVRQLIPGVAVKENRVKGTYHVNDAIHKLVSVHALKGMEFPINKDLVSSEGKQIDFLIDLRSVKSKKAGSLALYDYPASRKCKDISEHLKEIWSRPSQIYSSNGKSIGKAVVLTELFATTIENSLMIGNSHHTLKVRPEAHLLGNIAYDPYEYAIKPNERELEDMAALYKATGPSYGKLTYKEIK